MVSSLPVPRSFDEFDSVVASLIGVPTSPSMAYGISQGREVLFTGAAGFADEAKAVSASPQIPYSVASITKPQVSTLLAIFAERGLIDLDGSINRQLGGPRIQSRAGDADQITVRQVADHTSGLPTHYEFYYADEPFARRGMPATMERYARTFNAPGERYVYSNLGYGVLEYLLETVSGRPLHELMQAELFGPLGMAGSSLGRPENGQFALSYGLDGVAYPAYDFDHRGGSATYCSVDDLLAFGRFHLGFGPSVLSVDGLEECHRPTAVVDAQAAYGLGWGINADRLGLRSIQHTGFMGGVSGIIRLVPELDLTIVVLANGQSPLMRLMSDYLLGVTSPDYRARLIPSVEVPTVEPEAEPVPDRLIGTWSGNVETPSKSVPLSLRISSGSEAVACLDGVERAIEDLRWNDGQVLGVFDGDLRAEDPARRKYRIHLAVAERPGSLLNGSALTVSQGSEGSGGAPGKRYGNALAFWTELKRF